MGNAPVYYSLIADGNHTHETVQRIAYKANPSGKQANWVCAIVHCVVRSTPHLGAVLVTDAMSAMGLRGRQFSLGHGMVEVVGGAARLAGTTTLAGR